MTDEHMQNVRRQIYDILQRAPGVTSAFDPVAAQVEHESTAATGNEANELRALIDDDQRTIRAARLEIESVMESVESGSTYYSALEFRDNQHETLSQTAMTSGQDLERPTMEEQDSIGFASEKSFDSRDLREESGCDIVLSLGIDHALDLVQPSLIYLSRPWRYPRPFTITDSSGIDDLRN